MGLNVTCDCCGEKINETHEVGYLEKAYYGDCCIEKYNEYKKSIDDYHTEISKQVAIKMNSLQEDWLKENPKGSLPDV